MFRAKGKTLKKLLRSKKYAIILAHFFTAIFFAWVNLCKKDFARRPGCKGVPLESGSPEVARAVPRLRIFA